MESSGGGVTFKQQDLQDAKFLVGLLNKSSFADLTSVQIFQAARALEFARSLIPLIEDNIMEIIRVTAADPVGES